MGNRLLERLALIITVIHLDTACRAPVCQNTFLQRMLFLESTEDVCSSVSDFVDCLKASCNITAFPREMYDQLDMILSAKGLKCDFQKQHVTTTIQFWSITENISGTNSPVLVISSQMTATACVGVEDCQAALDTAILSTERKERGICGIFDDFFSCFRSKCGGKKLPYAVLLGMERSFGYLTSLCDFGKHFDIATTEFPTSELTPLAADVAQNSKESSLLSSFLALASGLLVAALL